MRSTVVREGGGLTGRGLIREVDFLSERAK